MPGDYTAMQLYRRVFRQARPYWPSIAVILLLNLLATPLALLTPLPLKIAVDSVISNLPLPHWLAAFVPDAMETSRTGLLLFAVVFLVVIGLLSYLNGLAIWLMQSYTGEKLVLDFRAALFRHVQRLSLAYHDARGANDATYRIQYDAPALQWISIDGVIPFVTNAITLAGMIYVIALLDWQLALVALVVAPVLMALTRMAGGRLRSQWENVRQLESSAMGVVQETLSALRVVKAFGQEEREQSRFVGQAGRSVRGQLRVAMIKGGFDLLTGLTLALGTAAVLYLGVTHVLETPPRITLGDLLIVMAYLAQLYGPLQSMSKKVTDLQASLASAARAFSLIDQVPDVVEKPHAQAMGRSSGHVRFEGVSYAYNPASPVLGQVNLDIAPGTRAGIVGRTGAGKTTLVSLLLRFFDPTQGRLTLDGTDLRDLKLADLRAQYSMVLQDPVLFSQSIGENIAYARPGATQEQIEAAARAAHAHEFILKQEQGYDTPVGERGMRLSGGERQRISIARAFLKDAPVLILDEPTSSVDLETEAAILAAMDKLMHGRTVFIIAHRLNTLQNCDLILRVEEGGVHIETDRQKIDATEVQPA
ncbi:MAG: ABC transporter ATP-binding protein [Phycisphaeraceae bacterium]